ncbi:hypothetical protein Btru_017129 [Bulinus truncatus]|nr:hypothetical protein Btru_017129 [Bulinus truncatus]
MLILLRILPSSSEPFCILFMFKCYRNKEVVFLLIFFILPKANHQCHPGGDESFSFVEFARRKLNQPDDMPNVIKTSVIIEGHLEKELGENEIMPRDDESTESFIKIKLVGKLSSTSTLEEPQKVTQDKTEEQNQDDTKENIDDSEADNVQSMDTQAGTLRTSVKTFKTRSIQTVGSDKIETEMYKNKAIPAKFEGTMMTPVYFDGFMITPERLDMMLNEASKKGDNFALPIKLQGGMLTTAFKAMSHIDDKADEPIPVKFHGKLQGLLESSKEGNYLPVTFDGSMKKMKKIE